MSREALEILCPAPGRLYIDCTLGSGGHSREILAATEGQARVLGIDKDPLAIERSRERLREYGSQVTYVNRDFRNLREIVQEQGISGADGIIFDFGVSSPQVDSPERGFSYLHDAPLDMRMDPSQGLTAAEVVNTWPEDAIARVIRQFGEERWAQRIAQFVVSKRKIEPICTTGRLVEVIKAAIPAGARRAGPHPARRTFQALRIAVNDELEAIREGLRQAPCVLNQGGCVVGISFHSLEDRIVKQTFRDLAKTGALVVLTRKPVVPGAEEIEKNPRARSAKLRAARKVLKAGEVE
jgi:16S rRNA (cytosine1402-N4)-methyltransferase